MKRLPYILFLVLLVLTSFDAQTIRRRRPLWPPAVSGPSVKDSVTKTWAFLASTEDLADGGGSSVLTFAALASDGNPQNAVHFSGSGKAVTETEQGRKVAETDTWVTWGVTAGATVDSLQITGWSSKVITGGGKLTSFTINIRVVDSAGTAGANVCASNLVSVSIGNATEGSWTQESAGSRIAVQAAYKPAAVPVRLVVECVGVWGGGSGGATAADAGVDQVALKIWWHT